MPGRACSESFRVVPDKRDEKDASNETRAYENQLQTIPRKQDDEEVVNCTDHHRHRPGRSAEIQPAKS